MTMKLPEIGKRYKTRSMEHKFIITDLDIDFQDAIIRYIDGSIGRVDFDAFKGDYYQEILPLPKPPTNIK